MADCRRNINFLLCVNAGHHHAGKLGYCTVKRCMALRDQNLGTLGCLPRLSVLEAALSPHGAEEWERNWRWRRKIKTKEDSHRSDFYMIVCTLGLWLDALFSFAWQLEGLLGREKRGMDAHACSGGL